MQLHVQYVFETGLQISVTSRSQLPDNLLIATGSRVLVVVAKGLLQCEGQQGYLLYGGIHRSY